MTSEEASSAAELKSLLQHGKTVSTLPRVIRSRVLGRASASILQGASSAPDHVSSSVRSTWPMAWVAGVSFVLAVGGVAIARHGYQRWAAALVPTGAAALGPTGAAASPPHDAKSAVNAPSAPSPATSVVTTAEPPRVSRPAPVIESYAAELDLLRRAQAAYGHRDFATTLRLLAEHGRRFPSGRLAEEREALRVRALAGSGHSGAARMAASSFAVRFPHSVLLVRTMAAGDARADE
ncbi:MAG: hypothetical protein ABI548_06240 [Polyangiaceae bacterium]